MMNRLASLQKRAADVCRALFRAQPQQVRTACVYIMLRTGAEMPRSLRVLLSQGLGAVFILKGVRGLPPVHGKSAEEFLATIPESKRKPFDMMNKLPPDYLSAVASSIWNNIVGKLRGSTAEQVISNMLPRFLDNKWSNMHDGLTLQQAISYTLTALDNRFKDERRHENSQHIDYSFDETNDEGDAKHVDPMDPNAMKNFIEEETRLWHLPRVRHVLETKVHPDAAIFLDLLSEGYTMKEIVGDAKTGVPSMLPHVKEKPMVYYNWLKTYNPKIVETIAMFNRQEQEGQSRRV
jgi:hypothetical protein